MGILLIAMGLLLLISEIIGADGLAIIMRWWPIILVTLGIEILIYVFFSKEEQPKIKYDGLSIFLVIFLILVSTGFYGVSTFMESSFFQSILDNYGYF